MGSDGWMLLKALEAPATPDWMKTLPAITTLRLIWEQQFEPREQGGYWRLEPALPAGQMINSPYDLDARSGKKRNTMWVGYKVHFTQTCDEDLPQLITHVQTTHAALPDGKALSGVHADLADKALLPNQHLVDSGYIDAANLHESRVSYEVDLVGPTLKHDWYQAGTNYDLTHFSIDWDAQTVNCPQGHISSSWTPAQDPKGRPVIKIKFSQSDCRACPSQAACLLLGLEQDNREARAVAEVGQTLQTRAAAALAGAAQPGRRASASTRSGAALGHGRCARRREVGHHAHLGEHGAGHDVAVEHLDLPVA